MPTYRNDSNITVSEAGITIEPGQTVSTYKILKSNYLTKTSDDPILPIALSETTVSASAAGDEISVSIDVENCNKIEILDVTTKIELRANVDSSSNPYVRTIEAGDKVTIRHDREIETLYIKFPDSIGSCKVVQLKED